MLRLMNILRTAVDAYCGLMLLGIVVILLTGAFYRYVLNNALYWSDSLAVNMFTWLLILGAAISVRHGSMFNITLVQAKSRSGLLIQQLAAKAVTLAVYITVLAYSWSLALEQTNLLLMAFPGLFPTVNMSWVYICLPIAFVFMTVEELIHTAGIIAKYRSGAMPTKE